MRLHERPGSIGTEVSDVGPAGSALTRGDVDELRTAWDRRHLLLLRGCPLSDEQQLAFVARFGRLIAERRPWGYVANVREDAVVREGALLFHSDFAFTCAPVEAIALQALEMPSDGAPTFFADACAAVHRLPAALQARLVGRQVLNTFDFAQVGDRHVPEAELAPGSPRAAHPVLGVHPRTGEPVCYANQMHSDRIIGVPADESRALLADLFAVLYDPQYQFEHRWQVSDLVLWDNVALHHARHVPPPDEPRTLRRITLGDYTPTELVPNLATLLAQARSPLKEPP